MTVAKTFEKILRHVSKALAERDWETTPMQVLNELADEFAIVSAKRDYNHAAALLSFGA